MKIYMIAGEASGDLHGSNLMKAMQLQRHKLQFRVWGGDLMAAAGGDLVKHYRDLAFMGFVEVLLNIRTILGNIAFCKQDILQFKPDVLVLIDYPGFNLRIAKWAKKQGIRVVYYISPQIWAWHQSRVKSISRDVDQMLVILRFEQAFYSTHGVHVTYVGHPLVDAVQSMSFENLFEKRKIVALLPGSRMQELKRILPRMLSIVPSFPDYTFVVAGTKNLPKEVYDEILKPYPQVALITGKTYSLLKSASAALVKSGTSTLETALLGTPQVVCYAGSPLSYQIAKRLIKVKYISLVNLVLDKPLVTELIQDELNESNLKQSLSEILQADKAAEIKEGYQKLQNLLGAGGASQRAATAILGEK